MTDLATIRIPVDTSDMVKAVQDTRRFEREIKVLYTAFQNGTINSKQYNAGIIQLRKEFQQLFGVSYQMATNRVRGHAKALEQQAITTKKLIADQKNLNAVMRESTTATTQSMKTQNQFGLVTQQVGYQVGDFVVQVQSGTNAFVAFGQQATQLAGLLYLIPGAAGAIAGTVTSILIPTITAALQYFSRTGEQAKTFAETLQDISNDNATYQRMKQSLEQALVIPMDDASRALREYLQVREKALGGGLIEQVQTGLGTILAPTISMQRDLEKRLGTRAVRFGPAGERQNLEAELAVVRTINETLAMATRGPASELGIRLIEAINELERGSYLSETMRGQLQQLVEETGLLEQAQESQNANAQEFLNLLTFNYQMYGKFRREGEQITTEQERFNQRLKDAYGLYASLRMQAQGLAEDTRLAAIKFLEMRQFEGTAAGQALARYGGRGTTERRALVANFDMTPERQTQRLRQTIDLSKELSDAERQRLDLIQSIEGSLESGFMAMVDGTKSVKDAFKSMARDIIAELYRVYVVQRIVGVISGKLFPQPAMLAPGIPVPPPRPANLGVRAAGGSIMPGGSYLVGEKGPEIIRPRHSGTVVPSHLSGQGGSSMTVNNNITVTGSDAANVRMEVAKMIPQITEATKAAVIDARRRGGQMRAAFV